MEKGWKKGIIFSFHQNFRSGKITFQKRKILVAAQMPHLNSTNHIIKGQEWSVWVTEVFNWPTALNMAFTFLQCLGGDKLKSRHWRLSSEREQRNLLPLLLLLWGLKGCRQRTHPWRSHSGHYGNKLEAQLKVSTSFSLQLPLIWMKPILALAKGKKRWVTVTLPSLNSQIWWLTGYHISLRKRPGFYLKAPKVCRESNLQGQRFVLTFKKY